MAEKDLTYLSEDEFFQLEPFLSKKNGDSYSTRSVDKIDTIVLHWTGGQYKGVENSIAWLRQEGTGYHFFIKEDGTVLQGVDISKKASHAGKSYGPNGNWVNGHSIGISFGMGYGKDTVVKEEMYQSFLKLLREMIDILPNLKYITGHLWISPERRSDPYTFPFKRLMSEDFVRDNNLELWKTGYAPFPSGLKDCKCVEFAQLNGSGKKYCKRSSGSCIGAGGSSYSERILALNEQSLKFSSDLGFSKDTDGTEDDPV